VTRHAAVTPERFAKENPTMTDHRPKRPTTYTHDDFRRAMLSAFVLQLPYPQRTAIPDQKRYPREWAQVAYDTYLADQRWQRLRLATQLYHGHSCIVYGDCAGRVDVAHLAYRAPFGEIVDADASESDLVPLCRRHHRDLDGYLRTISSESREAIRMAAWSILMTWKADAMASQLGLVE
jgi:hypothetical protein